MTSGQKAAATRKRNAAGKTKARGAAEQTPAQKAAATRKRNAAGKKAAVTKKRNAAGKKAAATRNRNAAGEKAAVTSSDREEPRSKRRVDTTEGAPSFLAMTKKKFEIVSFGPNVADISALCEPLMEQLMPQIMSDYRRGGPEGRDAAAVVFMAGNEAQVGVFAREKAADEIAQLLAKLDPEDDSRGLVADLVLSLRQGRGFVPGCFPCALIGPTVALFMIPIG